MALTAPMYGPFPTNALPSIVNASPSNCTAPPGRRTARFRTARVTATIPMRVPGPVGDSDLPSAADQQLRQLFHRLNNQLGIILAHAELLEAKAIDDVSRARASQVVASVLDAMGTTREIRRLSESPAV